ncbi:MAG: hypothetical protein ACK2UK_12710, partial [Candidatus Promineifilaceae bacterium]
SVIVIEPELIEIIEGPTPEFRSSAQVWLQSLHEGPEVSEVAMCQLRTMTGPDILQRCENAWEEGRPVRLDYPDEWGMRQQLDVVAMRLSDVDEGEMLTLWVSVPFELLADDEEEEFDEEDDDDFFVD